jgi:hypothetical protein
MIIIDLVMQVKDKRIGNSKSCKVGHKSSRGAIHYYILCPFAKGQTKNLKVLRKKNKKPEGFAKEKKSAKFAM